MNVVNVEEHQKRKNLQNLSKKKAIALISCGAKKQAGTWAAKNLYSGSLFFKTYKYAKQNYDEVYILSALYGLLPENKMVRNYDKTLNTMTQQQIIDWSKKVADQINQTFNNDTCLYIIAGKKYYEHLIQYINNSYVIICENMNLFERMKWLNNNTNDSKDLFMFKK